MINSNNISFSSSVAYCNSARVIRGERPYSYSGLVILTLMLDFVYHPVTVYIIDSVDWHD